jgi:hypothetical protein
VQANGSWSVDISAADLQQIGATSATWQARFDSVFGTIQQASASLSIDTQGPSIALTTPADVAISDSEAQVWFTSLTISDAVSGVDTATQTARLYRGADLVSNPDLALQTNTDGLAARLTADFSRLSDGNYTIEVQAKDRAGNLSSQSLALRLDQTAPTLSLSTDAAGLLVQKGEQATVRLSLSEAASALPTITPSEGGLSAWQPVANSANLYEAKWTPPTDGNGILSWTVGPWRDTAGNTGSTLGQPPPIQFDTLTPVVKSLQVLGDSTDQRFKAGETIEAHVVFSEDMLVTGQPTLELQVGDQIRSARYIGRLVASDATLVFRYVVQAGDTDTDGVAISANAIMFKLKCVFVQFRHCHGDTCSLNRGENHRIDIVFFLEFVVNGWLIFC